MKNFLLITSACLLALCAACGTATTTESGKATDSIKKVEPLPHNTDKSEMADTNDVPNIMVEEQHNTPPSAKPKRPKTDSFVFAGLPAYWKPGGVRYDGMYDSVHRVFQKCGSDVCDPVGTIIPRYDAGTCDAQPRMCLMRIVRNDSGHRPLIQVVPGVSIEVDTIQKRVQIHDIKGKPLSVKNISVKEVDHLVKVSRTPVRVAPHTVNKPPVLIFRNRPAVNR